MQIEDFGPYRQAKKTEEEVLRIRRLARALTQMLGISPKLELGALLGEFNSGTQLDLLACWIAQVAPECEEGDDRELLRELARRFEIEINQMHLG